MKAQNARPVPPEFREAFIRGGWRYVEHLYGPRTDVLRKWLFIVGLGDKEARKIARKGK